MEDIPFPRCCAVGRGGSEADGEGAIYNEVPTRHITHNSHGLYAKLHAQLTPHGITTKAKTYVIDMPHGITTRQATPEGLSRPQAVSDPGMAREEVRRPKPSQGL